MKKFDYSEVLKPSRMIEIDQNIEMLITFGLTGEEREYFEFAIKMPTSEIKTFIEFYDNSSPKYDELKFISMLMTRYNECRENIIKRIRQVRSVIKYEKQLEEAKNFSKILEK
jgi:hypothetical protein